MSNNLKTIKVELKNHVAIVYLNRPKLNAMNVQFFKDLLACFTQLKHDSSVRSILLLSAFQHFSAGLDLKEATAFPGTTDLDPARAAFSFMNDLGLMQDSITAIEQCKKPVIVCVLVEINDICFTGRVFDAKEALNFGLVSRLYEDRKEMIAEGFKLAVEIGDKPPIAVRSIKEILLHSRDHSVEDGLKYVAIWNSVMLNSPDTLTAGAAALSKSKATYSKL
ncbi:putative enoyl CoA hydratase [Terramyces sp. JEL0728]|nr:putative enoyl CoA hydratase [Terramyces sp. JEL0728]